MLSVPVLDAQAVLTAVDPGPYIAANGFFPAWYQDSQGVTLDLCLSKAVSSRVAGAPGAPSYMCVLLPNPGIFDDTLPIVFPTNFPDESFWFTGDASIVDAASGINLIYVSAIEAAFGGGVPLAGDQVSFARIRIRVDVPVAGLYTITHPYGVEIVQVDVPGRRAINLTRDIGIGAPGVFTGALAGDIGPFVRGVGGPYTETNPDTNVLETFIGDPNLAEQVTGSPFNTNFVRVQGPGIDVQTDLFAVSGKLSTVAAPATPLVIERSTYSRVNAPAGPVAQQDVFVKAPITATVTAADSEGTPIVMTDDDDNSGWYGQSANDPTALPDVVTVTATNVGNALNTQTSNLVDLIIVSRAEYSPGGTLVVEAVSSDEVALPALTVNGQTMALVGAGPLKSATITGLTVPPAFVTVTSANGGSDTEDVVVLPTAPLAP